MEMFDLDCNIGLLDLSLYLKKQKMLVVTDLHIGLEEALNSQGFLVPRQQHKDMKEKLRRIISKIKPDEIVILGDLKHEFGKISKQEWKDTLDMIDFFQERTKEIILIKGNHDTILGPLAGKKNLKILDYYFKDGYYFCHGNNVHSDDDFKKAHTILIGHQHPAITIGDEYRRERYKCFLDGQYDDKRLIVIPCFSPISKGTDVSKEKLLSPFLKKNNVDSFEVFVCGDKIYSFGKLGKIRET
ncbi:MAG: metallophosphoesterase [Candidatus Woesearchaeota archaeon]